ncbi:ribosomal-processing cysteine protease Prp [Bacillus cereus]|nr:ribosomal-processing cysteine protease Prp [Bacillus cereus]PGP75173.1 ribosomal-processing cysteine protease Prp [Bacillus cereus]
MISISILHNNLDYINGFIVDGHANYSSYGEDIVCASVSTITIGTVNAIEKFCQVKMQTEVRDGYLKAIIPIDRNDKKGFFKSGHDIQLLLQSMAYTLRDLEKTYAKHIRITTKNI